MKILNRARAQYVKDLKAGIKYAPAAEGRAFYAQKLAEQMDAEKAEQARMTR